MHLEQAYDDACSLHRQVRSYVRGLASFGLDDDDLEKDALHACLGAMRALHDARTLERELQVFAASLGCPRDVVIEMPRRYTTTAPSPMWLRDAMQMGLS